MSKKKKTKKGCLIFFLLFIALNSALVLHFEKAEKEGGSKSELTQEDYRYFDNATSVPITNVVNGYLTIFTVEDASTAYTVSTNNTDTFNFVKRDCFENEKIKAMIKKDEDLRYYQDAVYKFIVEANRSNKALRNYADTLEPSYLNKIKDQFSRVENQYSNILGYREDVLKKCGYTDTEIKDKMDTMEKEMHAIN